MSGEDPTVVVSTARDGEASAQTSTASVPELEVMKRVREKLRRFELRHANVGRYQVRERLGGGGMGEVFRAFDPELDRTVAIKFVRVENGGHNPEAQARLAREALALAKLDHPNVVEVYDVGVDANDVFLVMELVDGATLKEWLCAGGHSASSVLEVFVAAGRGLAAAHALGIVHRDVKPDNVIVGDDGRVRVLDFGLARNEVEPESASDVAPVPDGGLTELSGRSGDLTRDGVTMGTPAYMAPEQHAGEACDARSDQFSFCVALWEALAGARPFAGKTMRAVALDKGLGPPPRPATLEPKLYRILARGLEPAPSRRYPTLAQLLDELLAASAKPARWRWGVLATAGVVVVAAAFSASAHRESSTCAQGAALVDAVWGTEQRDAVEQAAKRNALPYARIAVSTTQERLDEYAQQWANAYSTACTRWSADSRRLDASMQCLERKRRSLGYLGTRLAEDGSALERALDVLADVGPVASCLDAERLLAEVPVPEDPGLATKVEAIRLQFDQADAAIVAGEARSVRDGVDIHVQRARALGFDPLTAEALLQRGRLRATSGMYEESRADLEEAWSLAVSGAADAVARDVAIARSATEGKHFAAAGYGPQWVRRANAWLDRTGRPTGPEVRWLLAASDVHLGESEFPAALQAAADAAKLARESLGKSHPSYETALTRHGELLNRAGRYQEAIVAFQDVLEVVEARYGDPHPRLANAYNNVGWGLLEQQRPREALPYIERAIDIAERGLGESHPDLAMYVGNLALYYSQRNDDEQSLKYLKRGLELADLADPNHPRVSIHLINLAAALAEQGRCEESMPHYERALEILRHAHGDVHPHIALCEVSLGQCAMALEDPETATRRIRRGIEIYDKATEPTHRLAMEARMQLLELHIRSESAAADETLSDLVGLIERAPERHAAAELRFRLGKMLARRPNHHARGVVEVEAALSMLEDSTEPIRNEVEQWLSNVSTPSPPPP